MTKGAGFKSHDLGDLFLMRKLGQVSFWGVA